MTDLFRSARLLYRAVDSPGDDAFFRAKAEDSVAVANSRSILPKPVSKKSIEDSKTFYLEQTLLGVVICLPQSQSSSTATTDEPPKPIPIGTILLFAPTPGHEHHRNSVIAINILDTYQGQGYGSEAIQWILGWGFNVAGLHRIGIECFSWNEGARRLYPRLGFTLESVKREALFYNGGWGDIIGFGMLEGEWREKQMQR